MPALGLLIATLIAGAPPAENRVYSRFLAPEEIPKFRAHLDKVSRRTARQIARRKSQRSVIADVVAMNVMRNLIQRPVPQEKPKCLPVLTSTRDVLQRRVVDYEAYKLRTFVSSGVFPKRYFGYFDEECDTAEYEKRMRAAVRASVDVINAHAVEIGSPLRVTDIEIAVTFISEGGAILLRERQQKVVDERIHPISDVGLDDIALGWKKHPRLVTEIDRRLGTGLASLVKRKGEQVYLTRYMSLEEAVAGTAGMYWYEKQLAATKLSRRQKRNLHELPLDEQFVISSLVYNSGILFKKQRTDMILAFETGAYLRRVSDQNAKRRWPLNVFDPKGSVQFVLEHGEYPSQPTSWAAVYHILQRYGGYAALRRFTDVFDERGRYRPAK